MMLMYRCSAGAAAALAFALAFPFALVFATAWPHSFFAPRLFDTHLSAAHSASYRTHLTPDMSSSQGAIRCQALPDVAAFYSRIRSSMHGTASSTCAASSRRQWPPEPWPSRWLSLRLVQSGAVEPGDWIAPGNAKLDVVRKAERCNWSRNRVGLDATAIMKRMCSGSWSVLFL